MGKIMRRLRKESEAKMQDATKRCEAEFAKLHEVRRQVAEKARKGGE